MSESRIDFIKNPKEEINPIPHGCDFWKPRCEDETGTNDNKAEKKAEPVTETKEVKPPEMPKDEKPKEPEIIGFKCDQCDYKCKTEQGIKMHISKSHKD
jgi:hypothetical protein